MWIVKLALKRPYTFIVLALLVLILSPVAIMRMPTDIFPDIKIPVIAVAWQYTGLDPLQMEGRITTPYEKALTTLVNNIQRVESTTYNGVAVVKIYLQPGANLATANAQVTAASQFMLKQMPAGTLPPEVIDFSASTVPILELGVSGKGFGQRQLADISRNIIRPQLITVPGSVIPLPYGGKPPEIAVNMNQARMQALGIAPGDILQALGQQNVVAPSGTAKIGQDEYDIVSNAAPKSIAAINMLPIKRVGSTVIYLRDVATASQGAGFQTNMVRQNGRRGVLITIMKAGSASTLSVVKGIRNMLPHVRQLVPRNLKITPMGDQSVFVRGAISGVVRETVLAAVLTALMILLFLGSWRSTLIIAVSIPLSILTSIVLLGLLGQTINLMTLGGLALAVGILVDDATVTIENIERFMEKGHDLHTAVLEGASEIAVPALVSTLSICIVFLPMLALKGVAHFLFLPLAEAVILAMLASYFFSRTLVPTLASYMLRHKSGGSSSNPFVRFQRAFELGFEHVRNYYRGLLASAVGRRKIFVPAFLVLCLFAAPLIPSLGENFFPHVDAGEFILHFRGPTGMRIEDTARLADLVERTIRQTIPSGQITNIVDNIGLPYSPMNLLHSTSGIIGAEGGDIMVTLSPRHRPTPDYVAELREILPQKFPGTTFYFLPADITSQILDFGLPAPIDIEIQSNNLDASTRVASELLEKLRRVPGLVDLRIQQPNDYPTINVHIDRTKAFQGGFTPLDVSSSMLSSLSSSFQTSPMFYLDYKNGVAYDLVAQTPQYHMDTIQDIQNIPINHSGPQSSTQLTPELLGDLASLQRGQEPAVISHYNTRRVTDIYASVQGRDLGSAAKAIEKILRQSEKHLPRGMFLSMRGQVQTMRSSYSALLSGLVFAIVLVYLLIVVNFQSWLDPLIIIAALPASLAGIVIFLFLTHTTLSVPALMGTIMAMGVATANSVLVVDFAKTRLAAHGDGGRDAIEAGTMRFRPVCMTALAMMIGMVPMALGLGDGGAENAPLGRAVIGGLLFATAATLIFVPAVFALLHKNTPGSAAIEGVLSEPVDNSNE